MSTDSSLTMPFVRDDEEALFSRDIEGQLVRLDAPRERDYEKSVSLEIDGRHVTVPLAEPLKDAQGNIVLDHEGRTTPRYTTIYDAAVMLFEKYAHERRRESESSADPTPAGGPEVDRFPIPVLCHQPHMKPVAVCRLCNVQLYRKRGRERSRERKLLPACQHQVGDGMEVFTINAPGEDGDRVRRAMRVVTELLTADHLDPACNEDQELASLNELKQIADRYSLQGSRFNADVFASAASTTDSSVVDDSSVVFTVDHSACILCDRCSRACNDVKQNFVIGRTGKGTTARIGFDLNVPMGRSTCVQCGECMVSCPTNAITFKPVAKIQLPTGSPSAGIIPAMELSREPLFAGVPTKFLLWQQGLVVRRHVRRGDVLCRQGQPGNTAFIIKSGRFEVVAEGRQDPRQSGLLARLARHPTPSPSNVRFEIEPEDVIVGEMSCLSGMPRAADIMALEDGEVWEVRRNLLDRVMRSPAQRLRFRTLYRERALGLVLANAELFQHVPDDEYKRCVEFLKQVLTFVSVSPGQTIFQQGERADSMYLVRLGHIRVGVKQFGREVTVFYRGPGTVVGEIGLLPISSEEAHKAGDKIDRDLEDVLLRLSGPDELAAALPAGQRTATCSALDHVEMARIGRADFLEMIRRFPSVRRRLIHLSVERIGEIDAATGDIATAATRLEYINQGLYQGQSLLVLDLDRCTRCDLCTNACIEQHGTESHGVPITRLLREGLRFGSYLVATACRSCKDAYCMIGCPVDSIHRGKHLQIVIEDHCIGCGLCAQNCPYGNIFMIPNNSRQSETTGGPVQNRLVAAAKAATCDLCDADGRLQTPVPRCVYACPHDAAFRMTGEDLLKKVI